MLSTLHTIDAVETVNRIIDFFPPHHHQQVRAMLAGSLRGVDLAAARADRRRQGPDRRCEILRMTGRVRDMIFDPDETGKLGEAIADGAYYGMQTFDQALLDARSGRQDRMDEALKAATHPHDFKLLVAPTASATRRSTPSSARRTRPRSAARRVHLQPDPSAPVEAHPIGPQHHARIPVPEMRRDAERPVQVRHGGGQLLGAARLGGGGVGAARRRSGPRPARAGQSSSSAGKPLPSTIRVRDPGRTPAGIGTLHARASGCRRRWRRSATRTGTVVPARTRRGALGPHDHVVGEAARDLQRDGRAADVQRSQVEAVDERRGARRCR